MDFGFLVADSFFYLILMIGFFAGMFFARESDVIAEYFGLLVAISLFSLPMAGGLTLGMLYYWSAHKIDEIDFPGPKGYEKFEQEEIEKELDERQIN